MVKDASSYELIRRAKLTSPRARFGALPQLLLGSLIGLLLFAGCARGFEAAGGWSGVADGGDVVYVGSMEGQVLALDSVTGARREAFPAERDIATFGGIYGTPTVVEGRVYAAGFNGKVYALGTGTLQPEVLGFEVEGTELSKGVAGSLVIVEDKVVFGAAEDSEQGRLYVLSAENLQEVCRYPARGEDSIGKIWMTPVVSEGVAYFGDLAHRLYAVSVDDCTLLWPQPLKLDGGIASTPIVLNGNMYVGAFDRNFYEVDLATGQAEVLFEAGGWFWSGMAMDGEKLYVPNMDGKLYAVDPISGFVEWEFDTEGSVLSAPVLVNGQVVVGSDSRTLYVVDARTGEQVWEYRVDGEIRAPLMAKGSVVYVSTLGHSVYAVDVALGRVVWGPMDTKG